MSWVLFVSSMSVSRRCSSERWCVLGRARAARAALAASGCCRNSLSSESSLIGTSRRARRGCDARRACVRATQGALPAIRGARVCGLRSLNSSARAGTSALFVQAAFFGTRLVEES